MYIGDVWSIHFQYISVAEITPLIRSDWIFNLACDFNFVSNDKPIAAMADDLATGDLFSDPEGFYPPPPEPHFSEHDMLSGQKVRVRLVGSHPLYVRYSTSLQTTDMGPC